MDNILKAHEGVVDTKHLLAVVERIKSQYLHDGLQQTDIPGIISILMRETSKIKKLSGPEKKRLVKSILFHLIEQVQPGETDTELETFLKKLADPIIDAGAQLMKLKKLKLFACCMK